MTPILLLLGLIAAVGAAIMTGLLGFGQMTAEEKYAAKLSRIQDHAMSLEEIELSQPFTERFLLPLRDRLIVALKNRTPAKRQEELRLLIQQAGHPYGATVDGVLIAKLILGGVLGGVAVFVFLPFVHLAFPYSLVGLVAGVIGYILPERWLKQQAGTRRKAIENVIPDTIDLLTICLDAGLSFDAAIQRLAEKVEGPLRDELANTLTEIRYGVPRSEALQAFADRVGAEDLATFVGAVIQSQKLGVALGDTVRIQAAEIRRRRRQKAEEQAAQASLKMLFPMIGCIFPTLFVVLMGPVALILLVKH
ncbi:MAG TPA: type II secretion system F family protein [Candidatus Dormibacteraeota bacterium]|jgi:tight adherence protein C|nr:type II secretion system F family protein [Candidatus Dormibacteraeota bacterium]